MDRLLLMRLTILTRIVVSLSSHLFNVPGNRYNKFEIIMKINYVLFQLAAAL